MQSGLTQEQIKRYREDGYVFPLHAYDAAQATADAANVRALETQYGPRAGQILRQKSHLVLTWVDNLIRLDPVLDAVESLIGPDILCWTTSFFIKHPGDNRIVTWHQDATYWGLEADDIVSAWIALTPSHRGNGCMRVVPGTHTAPIEHQRRETKNNMLSMGQEVPYDEDTGKAVDIELAPGQFSLHHQLIVHGSEANNGTIPRMGLAIRYLKPHARQVVESTDTAMLVRGQDRVGHFKLEPRPKADMDPEAVAYFETMMATRNGGRYRRPLAS